MKNSGLSLHHIRDKVVAFSSKARPYSLVLFLLFITSIYGFVLFKLNTLSNTQPSPDAVSSQVQATQIPRIDPAIVQQLKSLQDNSVSVKALFDEARSNPF